MYDHMRGFLDMQFEINVLSSFIPILQNFWKRPMNKTKRIVNAMNEYD